MKKKRYKNKKLVKPGQYLNICTENDDHIIWYQGKLKVYIPESHLFTDNREKRDLALSLIDKKEFCIVNDVHLKKPILSKTGYMQADIELLINRLRSSEERKQMSSNQKYELTMQSTTVILPTGFSLTNIIQSTLYDKMYEILHNYSVTKDDLMLKILNQTTKSFTFEVLAIYAQHSDDAASRRNTKMVDISERGINSDSMQKKHIHLLVRDHKNMVALLPAALFNLIN